MGHIKASAPPARIRLAVPSDAANMIRVVNAAFAIETFLEGTRTDEAGMSEMLRTGELLVAEDPSGSVVACVYTECRGERGYFGMLAVDPSQQGKGLGKLMVEAAENHCRRRGCRFMEIAVLSLRTELPPFYRKLGYTETRTEEFLPPLPLKGGMACHKILMSKELSLSAPNSWIGKSNSCGCASTYFACRIGARSKASPSRSSERCSGRRGRWPLNREKA